MATQVEYEKRQNIVEFIKKEPYKEWSSSSESKQSEPIIKQSVKLKTLPQAEWRERDKVIADLKAALPNISRRDVRRFYLPYHQAILLELEEQDFIDALQYLKGLLDLDDKIGEKSPDVIKWNKPFLKDQKDLIDSLRDGLVAFEKANRRGDYIARATSLLDTALVFQSKTWEWWWIAERLYQDALSVAQAVEDDDDRTITLIRYLYGRFLFNELQNPEEALEYLHGARGASKGKSWNASKVLREKQGTIFRECNTLLYKILLILARKKRAEDPEFALKSCLEALERAAETDSSEYVNEALYELGKSYSAVADTKNALQCFSKLLATAKRMPDWEGVCNAHMELAFTYKQLGHNHQTEKHLRLYRENAEKFGFIEKLADAHYYTGEHFLSQGKQELSTAHLENALNLYYRLGLTCEADRARSIAGVSKGQERIKKYLNLLLRCGDSERLATSKICRWKNRREMFWLDDESDAGSLSEAAREISEDAISTSSLLNDQVA